eukprot:1134371-Pelagomonas_calceolata.AAC.6
MRLMPQRLTFPFPCAWPPFLSSATGRTGLVGTRKKALAVNTVVATPTPVPVQRGQSQACVMGQSPYLLQLQCQWSVVVQLQCKGVCCGPVAVPRVRVAGPEPSMTCLACAVGQAHTCYSCSAKVCVAGPVPGTCCSAKPQPIAVALPRVLQGQCRACVTGPLLSMFCSAKPPPVAVAAPSERCSAGAKRVCSAERALQCQCQARVAGPLLSVFCSSKPPPVVVAVPHVRCSASAKHILQGQC